MIGIGAGMENPNMKSDLRFNLAAPDVHIIKEHIWKGEVLTLIATNFNISQTHVTRIKNGEAWGNIPWPDGSTGPLPPGQAKTIKFLQKEKKGKTSLLEHPGITLSLFSDGPSYKALEQPEPEPELVPPINVEEAQKEAKAKAQELFDKENEAIEEALARRKKWRDLADTAADSMQKADEQALKDNMAVSGKARKGQTPPRYKRMDWDEIQQLAPHDLVVIHSKNDEFMREAVCIMCANVPREKWNEVEGIEMVKTLCKQAGYHIAVNLEPGTKVGRANKGKRKK